MTQIQQITKVDGLLQHTSINPRKLRKLATSCTLRRDTKPSLQMTWRSCISFGMRWYESRWIQKYESRALYTTDAFIFACIIRDAIIKQNNEVVCSPIKFFQKWQHYKWMKSWKLPQHIKIMKHLSLSNKKLYVLFKIMWKKH